MNPVVEPSASSQPHLSRRFGLFQATALNMTNMIGVGPFITIPLLISAMNGPQAMIGWAVAILITVPDGMIWSELGAAMPGSGGTYRYLREGYGRETWGRLMAFLFIWMFILSGPLEIASGYIGFAKYLRYVLPGLSEQQMLFVAATVGLVNIALLYRQITSIATITVSLWAGSILTALGVIVTGAMHFEPKVAFDFPPGAFNFSLGFLLGLGQASQFAVYDYLGYYDVCYIGDEVQNPGRVIPRSILFSLVGVAIIYFAINLSIIGIVPWRQFVPASEKPDADFVVAIFMEKIYGPKVATFFTLMVLWTALGSVFALLLGYSRIPYAAARDGTFFKVFGRLHANKAFPHVSLLVMGVIAILCSFISLGIVIEVLIATRILVQFIGQIGAVVLLRRRAPELERPYRIWLYPAPVLLALVGWIFVFVTSKIQIIVFSLFALALGAAAFFVWARLTNRWPFAAAVGALHIETGGTKG
jgi:amino acid transporter